MNAPLLPQPDRSSPRVLVIGAGMSGILTGIKLLKSGMRNFEILEMSNAVGGTWRDNTYPGLSCDVPAHTYAYTFEPNWKWKGLYAEGPEIRDYFEYCADKYGVRPYVTLNTRVNRISREKGAWTVATEDGVLRRADVVVSCIGALVYPKQAEIEGIETFAGARFHSARWDHSVPLDGRRIGVIGTGSTAVQITSALAGRASQFSLFQRTPQWVCRNFEMRRPDWLRHLQRRIPALARLSGEIQNLIFERTFGAAVVGSRRMMRMVEHLCQKNLDKVRDPELKKKLAPNYRVGCKRLIFSDSFYDAIQKPGVELVTEGIERIEPRGVRTRDGRLHELDVLVTATGFHVMDFTRDLEITGEQGQSLTRMWDMGARGHRGVAIAGFPNLFTIMGPHSPVGNFAITRMAENQLGYFMPLIRLLRDGRCASVEVKDEAQSSYNEILREGFKGTVWMSGCASWYLDKSGLPIAYPFTPTRYRQDMRTAKLEEFEIAGP